VEEGGQAPEAPINLDVSDWDATTVSLKWKAPENDGGAPLTFFIIEYKGRTDEEWQQGPKVKAGKNPNGKVDGLTTGVKYEFRVVAENRNGRSGASETTLPLLVKAQKAPAKIDRAAMTDKTVKINQQLDLAIPVEGEPAPECWWVKDGADLANGDFLKITPGTNVAKLLLIPAKRVHCGKYTLKAKNKWGEDSAEIDVQVIGKPTMPVGPLKISEVTKRSCHLSWKPSEDNGGSPISQYEIEKMDEVMGTWLPAGNTKGTSFDVRNLVEGKRYKFLVRSVNDHGDSPDLEAEDFMTAKDAFDKPTPPGKPKATNWGPDWAELSWKEPESDGGAAVESYKIEMRDADKRAWNEIGQTKETSFRAERCGIELEHQYVFRVTAINAGGESELSETSTAIEAMERFVKPRLNKDMLGKDKELSAAQFMKFEAVAVAEPGAKFSWFLPNGEQILPDGDRITIDNDTKNRSVLMFKNVERKHSGNLKLVAKNSEGEDEHEIRLNVLAPPTKPLGLLEVSKVTPTGCNLMWQKPADDGGSPLTGYVIEKKDVERDYWSVCGKISGKMATVVKVVDFDVTDLVEHFVYVFRVMATNAIGESEPLMSLIPTLAKHELDAPSQPYNINVVDFDKKWVKLEWCVAPGAKAERFIVEKVETFMIPKDEEEEVAAEVEGEEGEEGVPVPAQPVPREPGLKRDQEYVEYSTGWIHAGTTEDDCPEIKITDLQEGYRYQFRVKAANKAGHSYPSESTDEIIAKQRKQKPQIDKTSMPQSLSLPRGDNITIKVKVKGEPITDKSWFWGRREIKNCGTVNIEHSDYASKITIMSLERADTGTFTFRAENQHGSDEASVEINVMVPPQKPKGPMRIDGVYAEGCTVMWSPPEDNGGSPVTHYIIEKVQGNGENFIPCGRVNASENSADIKALTPNKEYRMQVRAANAMGESEPLCCVDSIITENPFQVPSAPGKPELVDWDSDHFDLKWMAPRNDGGNRISGYELEMRPWKDFTWLKAGEVKMQYERGVVEGVEVGQAYAVRVRARNGAGCGAWSLESDQLVCKHKALKPKVKLEAEKELSIVEGETLTVFANVEGEPTPDNVQWFISQHEIEDNPKLGVVIDNSKEHRSKLQIDAVSRKDSGILICEASNLHGKARATATLTVVGKPTMPEDRLIVSNVDDSSCKLSWRACADAGGLPVEYLVEKYLVQADTWMKQGLTSNTEYRISDLENGKEYGFRVFSVNEIGESEPLSAAKTVVAKNQYTVSLPPSAPEVTDGNERSMSIKWRAPIDDGGMPITGYHVEAKTVGGDWQPWELLDTPATAVTVQKLQKGFEYQFRVIAINKAGKSEASHPSRPRLAKESDLLPYLEVKGARDVTATAHERIKFEAAVFGEPAPSVAWTKGEDPVEGVHIVNTESSTKIVFDKIKKDQAGTYTLTINNRSGSDTAKFTVKVLDRPAAPEPPMKATMEGSNCVLLWKKVKEDGGMPIEHYQIEKLDSEKDSWCACGHTKDNTYTIKGLLPGHQYTFRICAVNSIGDSDFLTGEPVSVDEATSRGL